MMSDEAERKFVEQAAAIARRLAGETPIRVKYTKRDKGEVVFEGHYEPDQSGRWEACKPDGTIN